MMPDTDVYKVVDETALMTGVTGGRIRGASFDSCTYAHSACMALRGALYPTLGYFMLFTVGYFFTECYNDEIDLNVVVA